MIRHIAAQMLPPMVFGGIAFIVIHAMIHIIKKRALATLNWRHEITLLVFVMFVSALAWQTIIPGLLSLQRQIGMVVQDAEYLSRMSNFVPLNKFREIAVAIDRRLWSYILVEVIGNVAVFIPLGLLFPLLWKRFERFWMSVGICFAISLFIETVQLMIPLRATDVDDIIMNTLGGLIGYLLYMAIRKISKQGTDRYKLNTGEA